MSNRLALRSLLSGSRDTIFAGPSGGPDPFCFNEQVARVFDDMAERSIPGYLSGIASVVAYARAHLGPGSRVLDLGCSTATLLAALAVALPGDLALEGVDAAPAMLKRARDKLNLVPGGDQVRLRGASVLELADWEPTALTCACYLMQFLAEAQRPRLLDQIARCLAPGGVFVLSEKVRSSCARTQAVWTREHEAFKRERGYSEDEVARKRRALENVMICWSVERYDEEAAAVGLGVLATWNAAGPFVTRAYYKCSS